MIRLRTKLYVFIFLTILINSTLFNSATAQNYLYSQKSLVHPVYAVNGMVATQEHLATEVGLEILKKGGNAVDAAVGVGFALAVTLPRAGNIGGGGFMIIHDAKSGENSALDYREKAPSKAFDNMYLDKNGNAVSKLSRFHGLAVGVPGSVAGMIAALERYGSMSLSDVMAPAIKLASNGFIVESGFADSMNSLKKRLWKWKSTRKVFFKEDGSLYKAGDLFRQEDLAQTLQQIADKGLKGFYEGPTAEKIVKEVTKNGGIMQLNDFANYNAIWRKPVVGTYRGYNIISMPPPSSGGTHIVQILNILENFPVEFLGHNSANTIHLMAESEKFAYADRSKYLGDSDFVKVPVDWLTSKEYAKQLSKKIKIYKATPSVEIKPGKIPGYESNQTTHFSIVDKFGNAVSNTYTINFSYGTGLVADGTGVLLNNEMDDFSSKPGVPNAYGLIGGSANAVQAGKRPLSSMSPTIVLDKNNKVYLVTGSPGGSRIITTTLQIISNVIDHKMNIAEATYAPRVHHQWLPDELRVEKGLSKDTIKILVSMGHKIVLKNSMGSTQSIMVTKKGLFGSSDPRRLDALTKGH